MLPRSMAGLARFRSTGQIDPMEATPHNPVRAAHPLPLQTPVGALAEESTICCPWTQVVHEMPQPVSCPHPTRPANGHHVMVLPIPPHSLRLRSLPIDSSAQQPSHAPWSSCPHCAIPAQTLVFLVTAGEGTIPSVSCFPLPYSLHPMRPSPISAATRRGTGGPNAPVLSPPPAGTALHSPTTLPIVPLPPPPRSILSSNNPHLSTALLRKAVAIPIGAKTRLRR